MSCKNCDCGDSTIEYYKSPATFPPNNGGWYYWHEPIPKGCPECGYCPGCGRYLGAPPIRWVWTNDWVVTPFPAADTGDEKTPASSAEAE